MRIVIAMLVKQAAGGHAIPSALGGTTRVGSTVKKDRNVLRRPALTGDPDADIVRIRVWCLGRGE
ncbi:hypothetical protein IA69_15825 [Massilia sp. JS1662]|nr:hypothetical protein IA69_15825 [Massilia sp. JS1662]